jgi:hypothetical protein
VVAQRLRWWASLPDDQLWLLGNTEHLMPQLLASDVDFDGLTQWRGGQPQLGRREQDRAGRFPGAQPVEWLVIVRGDNQEISGIVCRAVLGWLAGLGKPPGGEVAQKRRVDQANRGWRQAVDRNAVVAPAWRWVHSCSSAG